MGRKPKPEHRKHSKRVVFMAMPHEYAAYEFAAEAEDKDLSSWARETLNKSAENFIVPPASVPPVKTPARKASKRKPVS